MSPITEHPSSRTARVLRRSILAGLGAAALSVALALPSVAAQPNQQACLGEDIRTYAGMGAGFGAFVAGMATEGGVGDEIQAHLAGSIPDTAITNGCNDD